MKISGTQTIESPIEEVYAMMQDPEVLVRSIPGCESLEEIGENEYRMEMTTALGTFDGKVRITDQTPPTSFRLMVEGSGKLGFMKGDGLLILSANGNGTEVSYEGDAQVGGTMAAVGQKLIEGSAKMLIRRFFEKLADSSGG